MSLLLIVFDISIILSLSKIKMTFFSFYLILNARARSRVDQQL